MILTVISFWQRRTTFPSIRGGDPKYNNGKLRWLMLFPAYAGVILSRQYYNPPQESFPRIRGGDPDFWAAMNMMYSFSPHTRG